MLKRIDYITGVLYHGAAYGETQAIESVTQLAIDAPCAVLVTKETNGYLVWTGYVSDNGNDVEYKPDSDGFYERRDMAIEAAVERIKALRGRSKAIRAQPIR
jgi:uncharacterized protein (DUF302 family)